MSFSTELSALHGHVLDVSGGKTISVALNELYLADDPFNALVCKRFNVASPFSRPHAALGRC